MDALSPGLISNDLETGIIGRRVIYYPSVTSTMEIAREEARRNTPEGTVILADEQTAGRGRLKRLWLSPCGSAALSIVLYPGLQQLPFLVMLASLAVIHSIKSVCGLDSQIKWPNDILIKGKKVCGILVESDVRKSGVTYAILGIGVNVNFQLAGFPEIASIATSLSDELGKEISRTELVRHLLTETDRLYINLKTGEEVYREWRDSLITLGRKVEVKSGNYIFEGIAESVDKDGNLLVRQDDGTLTRVIAGDVTLHDYDKYRGPR